MHVPWKRVASVAIMVLALGFLVALVRNQWSALSGYQWRLDVGWALLAVALLELGWLVEALTWNRILAGLAGPLQRKRALRAWFLSNLIRYVPGNVWQFLGMVELAAEDGAPRPATLASVVLHQAISTATGIVMAALYFAASGANEWLVRLRPLLLLTPLGLFLLQPRILERLLNWALARLGRAPLAVTLTWHTIWQIVLRYAFAWLLEGLSFVALARALAPFGWEAVPRLAASWAVAYIVGYLSMLTPSGLGVREATMAFLLAGVLPAPLPAVVPLVARLQMVVAELLGAGIAALVGRRGPAASVQAGGTPSIPTVEEGRLGKSPSR